MEGLQKSGVKLDGRPHNNGSDEGDVSGTPNSSQGASSARMPVDKDAVYYSMNHRSRGMALIFNHETFDITSLQSRTGTNIDCDNLSKVLKSIGFKVSVFPNKTASEIAEIIRWIQGINHSDHDCLLIAVLTHGEPSKLFAKDTYYKPDNLWSQFTADKCPQLAGKPKIFFIQACQDDERSFSDTPTKTSLDGLSVSYKIPVCSDFLIVYSTIPGYYAWHDTACGSWFIEALCYELRHTVKEKDILTLLTSVCRRVELTNREYRNKNRVPTITSRLTRLIAFGKQ